MLIHSQGKNSNKEKNPSKVVIIKTAVLTLKQKLNLSLVILTWHFPFAITFFAYF